MEPYKEQPCDLIRQQRQIVAHFLFCFFLSQNLGLFIMQNKL